jgi:hypothetical protein
MNNGRLFLYGVIPLLALGAALSILSRDPEPVWPLNLVCLLPRKEAAGP